MAMILCVTLNPAIDVTIELSELKVGAVNRQLHQQQRPAGKGLNVAQVLKNLGHDIIVTGFLGNKNQQLFVEDFEKQQFINKFILIDGETRHNIKIAEQSGRMTDINGRGFTVYPQDIQNLLNTINECTKQVDMVVLSGSLPQGFDLEDFSTLIKTIQQHNVPLAIDTSGSALATAIEHRPFFIKPNSDELTETYHLPANSFTEQQILLNKHCKSIEHIVVSMGADGVNWFHQGHNLHAHSPNVTVKSTVGAGDTLLAGMLHGLLSQFTKNETLTFATALASHAVTQAGLNTPDAETLKKLQQQVHITEF